MSEHEEKPVTPRKRPGPLLPDAVKSLLPNRPLSTLAEQMASVKDAKDRMDTAQRASLESMATTFQAEASRKAAEQAANEALPVIADATLELGSAVRDLLKELKELRTEIGDFRKEHGRGWKVIAGLAFLTLVAAVLMPLLL